LWAADGIAIRSAAGDVYDFALASDGAGGIIVAWDDTRSGASGIFVQRVDGSGTPQWTPNGVVLCPSLAGYPTLAADGAGGAVVAWADARNVTTDPFDSDVYAQRVSSTGTPQWGGTGIPICIAPGETDDAAAVPDGAGGAIVTWRDSRNGAGNWDIYAQRVNAAGVMQWTTNGIALCTAPGQQDSPRLVPDGLGGAIACWRDGRGSDWQIFAQRVNAAGATLWSSGGTGVYTGAATALEPSMCPDGASGAVVVWSDLRRGTGAVYAQRVSAGGVPQWVGDGVALCRASGGQGQPGLAPAPGGDFVVSWSDGRDGRDDVYAQGLDGAGVPQWVGDGIPVAVAPNWQSQSVPVSDGAGGAVFVWEDDRSGSGHDVYAAHLGSAGPPPNAGPAIVSVRDVPNDEGGAVKLSWSASYLDVQPDLLIDHYDLWRSVPASAAEQALRDGARLLPADASADLALTSQPPSPGTRLLTTTVEGSQIIFWEWVAAQVARGDPGYSLVLPTTSDSLAGSNPRTLFRVQARPSHAPGAFWNSPADSGYSVDNLPPHAPTAFSAAATDGGVLLHWSASPEPDLAGYRLYRGDRPDFVPDPQSRIAAPADTGYRDPAAGTGYYRLSAVDIHGNESASTTATVALPDRRDAPAPIGILSLAPPRPSPARDRTELHFALPQAGAVSLVLYDVHGRRVRDLADGRFDAGEHVFSVELRDRAGAPLGSGIYFVRLTATGRALVQRLAVVR
jgi:hypothetical protein